MSRMRLAARPTLRRTLTVWMVGVLGVGIGVLSILLYFAVRHLLWHQFDVGLEREARALSHLIEEHPNSRFSFEYSGIRSFEQEENPSYFQFWKQDGTVLARSRRLAKQDLPRRPMGPRGPGEEPSLKFTGRLPDGREGRYLQLTFAARPAIIKAPPVPHPATLVVGTGTAEVTATLAAVRLWLLGLSVLAVAIATAAASLALRRGLRSTTTLVTEIGQLDESHLGQRVNVPGLPLELAEPVAKLNEVLARLDESFARERRFTADVSHELRTPLAGLRSVLEVAAARPRSAEDYRATMTEAIEIVGQLDALIENLLMLARVDARQIEVRVAPVALRNAVSDVWRPLASRARERRLFFANQVGDEAILHTDADKLRLILANLLANATEYTAEGGNILVVQADEPGVILDVCDSGPPIPEAALPRLFERFYRADEARSAAGVHCGIGLAITCALGKVLGFAIEAANLPDGQVRFRIKRTEASGGSPERSRAGALAREIVPGKAA